jgi:hypothetical protein
MTLIRETELNRRSNDWHSLDDSPFGFGQSPHHEITIRTGSKANAEMASNRVAT